MKTTKAPPSLAYRLRWAILVLGISLTVVWLVAVVFSFYFVEVFDWETVFLIQFTPFGSAFVKLLEPLSEWLDEDTADFLIGVLSGVGFLGIMLITQGFFLRPKRNWTVSLTAKGRPMKISAIGGAFAAAMLNFGLVATLLELPQWYETYFWEGVEPAWWGMAAIIPIWIIWAIAFYFYFRKGERYDRSVKFLRGLIAGTILELLASMTVYAWDPHKQQEECFCARGSYTGLILGVTTLIWAFGPGIVLLFMHEKVRRERVRQAKLRSSIGSDWNGAKISP